MTQIRNLGCNVRSSSSFVCRSHVLDTVVRLVDVHRYVTPLPCRALQEAAWEWPGSRCSLR